MYLVQHGALSIDCLAGLLDSTGFIHNDAGQSLSYLLDSGYNIKANWVAEAINESELIQFDFIFNYQVSLKILTIRPFSLDYRKGFRETKYM